MREHTSPLACRLRSSVTMAIGFRPAFSANVKGITYTIKLQSEIEGTNQSQIIVITDIKKLAQKSIQEQHQSVENLRTESSQLSGVNEELQQTG